MSDTPRTDAVNLSLGRLHGEVCWWCEADFARTLERELTNANRELLVSQHSEMELCQERDQLRAEVERLKSELI